MLNFMRTALGSRPITVRRLSTGSLYAYTPEIGTLFTNFLTRKNTSNGISIRVGKPPYARPVHVPQSALRTCPTLCRHLVQGSTIINADPIVFEVILDYLDYDGLLTKLRIKVRNPLEQLIGGGDQMLKLVKAWHLAEMLDLPQLQNKLIDIFRILYDKLLASRIRMPSCPEPFLYLRNHMGNHTKVEKFIVDFYAGLARYEGEFRAEELEALPADIAQHLQHRRAHLAVRHGLGDCIASGNACFKVSKSDDTQRIALQVLPPSLLPARTDLFRLPTRRAYSTSTLSSKLSLQSPPPPTHAASLTPRNTPGRQSRFSLTGTIGVTKNSLMPMLQATLGTTSPPKRPGSPSMTTLSNRAPFMARAPIRFRSQFRMMEDENSADDESVYDLFAEDQPELTST